MLPFRKILVASDFSDIAAAAIRVAAGLRARGPDDAELTLVHAVEPITSVPFYPGLGMPIEDYPAKARKAAADQMAALAGQVAPLCAKTREEVHIGRPADVVIEAAERLPADLVVVGTHGLTGVRRLLFGSVAGEVLRRCERPVLTVPETFAKKAPQSPGDEAGYFPVSRILVPTDFSKGAREGLRLGLRIAAACGAELHLFHVVDTRSGDALEPLLGDKQTNVKNLLDLAEKEATAVLAREQKHAGADAAGIDTREHVRMGTPAHEVEEFVKGYEIDLVVMGSRGRSGVGDFLLGSTAERISRTSPVPVLTVRGA